MVNWGLAGTHKTQIVDIQRFRFMLLKAPSPRGLARRWFSAETGGVLTLGFILLLILSSFASSAAVAAGSVRRENRAPNGATLLPS